jgi:hypothetical protein
MTKYPNQRSKSKDPNPKIQIEEEAAGEKKHHMMSCQTNLQ